MYCNKRQKPYPNKRSTANGTSMKIKTLIDAASKLNAAFVSRFIVPLFLIPDFLK